MRKDEIKYLIVFVILTASILSLFYILKFRNSPYPSNYEDYYSIEAANKIKASGDSYAADIFYPSIFLLSKSENYALLMRLLPYLFSFLTVTLIFAMMNSRFDDKKHVNFAMLSLILSPVFLYTYTSYNMLFLPIFFIMLGSHLLMHERYFLSMLSFIAAFAFNPDLFIIIVAVLVILFERLRNGKLYVPLLVLGISAYLFISINSITIPGDFTLFTLFTRYVSDFGASFGLGIFIAIMGCIGIMLSWKNKRENAIMYYTLAVIFICSFYQRDLLIFIDLVLCYYSGLAFSRLLNSSWESSILKNYVLLLIICGLIFSSGSFIRRSSLDGPVQSEVLSLEWMGSNINTTSNVFSYYRYGSMITALSGSSSYADLRYYASSKNKNRLVQSEEIFMSRNLKNITMFLDKNKLDYIWINREMLHGEIWSKNDEGLLFVLHNSENFKKIYDYEEVQLWHYLR